MKDVRIETSINGKAFFVDVTCCCGKNGLTNLSTGERSFEHRVVLGGEELLLVCDCGKKYRVRPQKLHIHVTAVHEKN